MDKANIIKAGTTKIFASLSPVATTKYAVLRKKQIQNSWKPFESRPGYFHKFILKI